MTSVDNADGALASGTGRPALMRDVANLAGVSTQTVSRVVNGGTWVGAQTAARVQQAIEHLGYRRNMTARALATSRGDLIGVITPASSDYGPNANLFSVERAAHEAGYSVSVAALDRFDAPTVRAAVDRLTQMGVMGIVMSAPWQSDTTELRDLTWTVPVVVSSPVPGLGVPTVGFDEEGGARAAVQHLLDLGHRTVWHITGPEGILATDQRIHGWRSALLAAGAAVPEPIPGDWSSRSGYRAAARLLVEPSVTAVFAGNDQMALGVMRGLSEGGLQVPRDVSVVGYDSIPDSAYYSPPLTTVNNNYVDLGRRSLHLLLKQVVADPAELPPLLSLPTQLVIRASSAPPPPASSPDATTTPGAP